MSNRSEEKKWKNILRIGVIISQSDFGGQLASGDLLQKVEHRGTAAGDEDSQADGGRSDLGHEETPADVLKQSGRSLTA